METTKVRLDWNTAALTDFLDNPNGEVGQHLMRELGEVVLRGAKKRALVRTGHMRDSMRMDLGTTEHGVYVDIISPVPYAVYHERKKNPRDRRPHRSLIPAVRDARKVLKASRV